MKDSDNIQNFFIRESSDTSLLNNYLAREQKEGTRIKMLDTANKIEFAKRSRLGYCCDRQRPLEKRNGTVICLQHDWANPQGNGSSRDLLKQARFTIEWTLR